MIEPEEMQLYVKRGVYLLQLKSEFPGMLARGCHKPVLKIVRIVDASDYKNVVVSVDDAGTYLFCLFFFLVFFYFCFFLFDLVKTQCGIAVFFLCFECAHI